VTASDDRTADPAREGIEHLQLAAHEMIAAARSMLDAVEEILEDPGAASSMASAFGTMSRLIQGAVATVSEMVTGGASEPDAEPRVQRIKVS
jgi:F420-dependent methylenetetrahydromethanopterin dehydrogenase